MSDEVSVDDSGLTLPIDVNAPVEEPETREITPEDLRALAEVEAELDQRWSEVKIDPTLTRMELLMDLLGNPERSFPAIHVAGTNGKTSTVRMIEALMRAFHRRTGRTTSPHLQLATERIAIDGQPLHPRDYVRTWREIQPYVEMADAESEKEGGPKLSKFEVLTAMSYAAFADAPVDVAVVEVGMGGLWDATNVINADVAVITPIGLDHTDYLGSTVEEVAREKAGYQTALGPRRPAHTSRQRCHRGGPRPRRHDSDPGTSRACRRRRGPRGLRIRRCLIHHRRRRAATHPAGTRWGLHRHFPAALWGASSQQRSRRPGRCGSILRRGIWPHAGYRHRP